MRQGAPSPWDQLRESRAGPALRGILGEPRWIIRAREARRIDAFERGHVELAAVGRVSDAASISRELRERTDYWSAGRPAGAEVQSLATEISRVVVTYCLLILAGLTVLLLLITGLFWLTIPVAMIAWLARRYVTQRGLLARLNLASGGRRCPGCLYDLADSPPGLPPGVLHGQWPGPRKCPECGAAWPLVPPPVPQRP